MKLKLSLESSSVQVRILPGTLHPDPDAPPREGGVCLIRLGGAVEPEWREPNTGEGGDEASSIKLSLQLEDTQRERDQRRQGDIQWCRFESDPGHFEPR